MACSIAHDLEERRHAPSKQKSYEHLAEPAGATTDIIGAVGSMVMTLFLGVLAVCAVMTFRAESRIRRSRETDTERLGQPLVEQPSVGGELAPQRGAGV